MPLKDFDRIVAARKLASRRVFDADDSLALFQNFHGSLFRNHQHAVQVAEDEIARMNEHRIAQFAGDV